MKTTLFGLAAAVLLGQAAANYNYGPDSNSACSELSGGADAYDICDKKTGECVNIMTYNMFYHWDNAWKEPENCGACGHTCPGDDSVCSMGECCPHSSPLYCPKTGRCHKAAPFPQRRTLMSRNISDRSSGVPIEEFDPQDLCECPKGYVDDVDAPNTCRACYDSNAIEVEGECKECVGGAIADDNGEYCLCPPGKGYFPPGQRAKRDGRGDWNFGCKPCGDNEIANENSECKQCEGKLEPNKWGTECVCPAGWVPNTILPEKCEECEGDKIAYKGNCISCPKDTVPNAAHDQCVCTKGYAWIMDTCTKCNAVGANYNEDTKGCTCPTDAQFDEDYKCHCKPGMELVETDTGDYECVACAHDMVSEDGLKCHQCPVPMTANYHHDECVCDIWGASKYSGECKCPENMQEELATDLPFFLGMSFRGYCKCDANAVPSKEYESGCMVCKDLAEPRVPNDSGTSCVLCSVNKQPNADGTKCECKPGYKPNGEYGCDKEGGDEPPYEEPKECDGADLQTDAKNCGTCGNVCKASDKPDDVKDRWWWRWWGTVGQYRPQKTGKCSAGVCI